MSFQISYYILWGFDVPRLIYSENRNAKSSIQNNFVEQVIELSKYNNTYLWPRVLTWTNLDMTNMDMN